MESWEYPRLFRQQYSEICASVASELHINVSQLEYEPDLVTYLIVHNGDVKELAEIFISLQSIAEGTYAALLYIGHGSNESSHHIKLCPVYFIGFIRFEIRIRRVGTVQVRQMNFTKYGVSSRYSDVYLCLTGKECKVPLYSSVPYDTIDASRK